MAAVTAAVTAGVVLAGTAYQVDQSRKAAKEAKKSRQATEREIARKSAEDDRERAAFETETKNEEARESAVKDRRRAVARQQTAKSEANGKGGTLLTGPTGVSGNTIGQSGAEGIKTLLGG